jgi:hypothetical protein
MIHPGRLRKINSAFWAQETTLAVVGICPGAIRNAGAR